MTGTQILISIIGFVVTISVTVWVQYRAKKKSEAESNQRAGYRDAQFEAVDKRVLSLEGKSMDKTEAAIQLAKHDKQHAKHFDDTQNLTVAVAGLTQQIKDHVKVDDDRFKDVKDMFREIRDGMADIRDSVKK
jgi:hypothetical protein